MTMTHHYLSKTATAASSVNSSSSIINNNSTTCKRTSSKHQIQHSQPQAGVSTEDNISYDGTAATETTFTSEGSLCTKAGGSSNTSGGSGGSRRRHSGRRSLTLHSSKDNGEEEAEEDHEEDYHSSKYYHNGCNNKNKMGEYDDDYHRSPYDDDDPEDFPEAEFDKNLDEAFGPPVSSGTERSRGVRREKSGSRRRPSPRGGRRDRSPDSSGPPVRGLARQRSKRRANIAAAVSMIGSDDAPSGVPRTTSRSERKPRRNRTHEDRLNAASMGDPMGVYNQDIDLGFDDEGSGGGGEKEDRHRGSGHRRGDRHSRGGSREAEYYDYDDYDIDEGSDDDRRHGGGRGGMDRSSRRLADRGPRRGEEDYPYDYDDDRRSKFKGKGATKSFDESSSSAVRTRGRRRASMMGAVDSQHSGRGHHEEDVSTGGIRARRTRRGSVMAGAEGGGAPAGRAEPASRGVRESRSAGRVGRGRRASLFGAVGSGEISDLAPGFGASSNNLAYDDDEDEPTMESQKAQEWQENRANKQRAMLERLKKREEEPEPEEEEEEEEESLEGDLAAEEEPDEEEKEKERKSRRRASLGITKAFGMSSSNFAGLDKEVEKEKKKEEKRLRKEEKEREKAARKLPGRSKSTDGGIVVPPGGGGGRARATDRDRRRPGTMLDRIGADQGLPARTRSGPPGR